jgi:hypothetical protein
MKKVIYNGLQEGLFIPEKFRQYMKEMEGVECIVDRETITPEYFMHIFHAEPEGVTFHYEWGGFSVGIDCEAKISKEIDRSHLCRVSAVGNEEAIENFKRRLLEKAIREGTKGFEILEQRV